MSHVRLANGQITDAVTQTGVSVLGDAASLGMASQYLAGAHAAGLSIQNATAQQRQGNTLGRATTAQAAVRLLTLGPAQAARASKETLGRHSLLTEIASLTAIARRFRRAESRPGAGQARMASPMSLPGRAAPEPQGAAPGLGTLAAAAESLAKEARALAGHWQEGHIMGENTSSGDGNEAINRFRAALDQLGAALEEAVGQLKDSADSDLRRRLQAAIQDLRNAAGQFRPAAPSGTVPAGATHPGVVIVGSGNVSATLPTRRIVGASW